MDDKYNKEVQNRWKNTKEYNEYVNKSKDYSKEDWKNINNGLEEIFKKFSEYLVQGKSFDSDDTVNLVIRLQNYISDNYYYCSNKILLQLGKMYIDDERFKNNIDKYYKGTAEYVNEAIEYYIKK